jgi:outer membrane receptor protein involved in Fe transport
LRFGGEFRRSQLEEFYHRHGLGTLRFDGSQGPWANDTTVTDSNVLSLADFLGGYFNPKRTSIALGNPTRLVYVKTFSLFAQDAWQVSRKLTVNYVLRWDYEGPLGNDKKDLSVFDPAKGGLVFQGAGISHVYPRNFKNFAPRLGVAYKPKENGDLVVRGGPTTVFRVGTLQMYWRSL